MFDVTYKPQSMRDMGDMYENTEPYLIQSDRVYPSINRTSVTDTIAASVDVGAYIGALHYAGARDGDPRYVPAYELFSPHTVIILFDGVGGDGKTMSFSLESVRHIEGVPSKFAGVLETDTAKLRSADSPLELLRRHDL